MKHKRAVLGTLFLLAGLSIACVLYVRREQHQDALNRQLVAAGMRGDDKQALTLVNAGADPNTRFIPESAPSLPELLKRLLHRSRQPVNDSPTAFSIACGASLVNDGASHSMIDNCPDAPQLVQAMLTHGADTKAKGDIGWTPLMGALFSQHQETVRLLLAHGAKVNELDENGSTLLFHTIFYTHNKDLVRQLLLHGADPNLADRAGQTPLWIAQQCGNSDIVALLKQAGARK